jgi:hypothetical protein
MHYVSNGGRRPEHPRSFGNPYLSSKVLWPDNLAALEGFTRVAKNFRLENMTLLEAMSLVARKAGAYDLNVRCSGWKGQIEFVQVSTRKGGTQLRLPQYGNEDIYASMNDPGCVMGGHIAESCVNYFDDVCVAGDPPAVERFFYTDKSSVGVKALVPAWTTKEEDDFKACVTANGDSKVGFEAACLSYPLVYAAWKLKVGDVPIWSSNSKDQDQNASPVVRLYPHLLTGYAEGGANPRTWDPRHLVVESYDGVNWNSCNRFNALEVSNDGSYLMLDGLRAQGYTCKHTNYEGSTFEAKEIRLSAVASGFSRITGIAGSNSNGPQDPNGAEGRVEQGGETFSFQAIADPMDYVEWERETSRPNGENVAEPSKTTYFPDKVGSGNELYTDRQDSGTAITSNRTNRLPDHARKRLVDVKRVEYSGQMVLAKWNPGLRPGMQVYLDGGGIVPTGIIRSVRYDANSQTQVIELAAADNSRIYDISPAGGAVESPKKPTTVKPQSPQNPSSTWDDATYEREQSKADSHWRTKGPSNQQNKSADPSAPIPPSRRADGNAANARTALGAAQGEAEQDYVQENYEPHELQDKSGARRYDQFAIWKAQGRPGVMPELGRHRDAPDSYKQFRESGGGREPNEFQAWRKSADGQKSSEQRAKEAQKLTKEDLDTYGDWASRMMEGKARDLAQKHERGPEEELE